MKCGFIILNYNSWQITKELALSISRYKKIDYVIIVDNCSPNESFDQLKEIENEKIVVKKSNKNGGYSYGNNFGASICKDMGIEIMIVSNPDVQIEERDLNLVINKFDDTDYSLLTGVEYDINKNISNPPIWKLPTYTDDLIDCFFLGRKFTNSSEKIRYDIEIQPISIFKGSFFAIRLKDFLDVEGFDDNVFLFCEERILSKKLLDSNKKIGLVTNAKYYHNHSYSINKEYKEKAKQIQLLYKSRIYYQQKYLKNSQLKRFFLKICMLFSEFEYKIMDKINGSI